MKNLIVQVCIPNEDKVVEVGKGRMFSYIPEMYQCCIEDAREYAKNVEADYYLMTTKEWDKNLHPCYQRFEFFEERFDKYDNILQFDGDYAPVPTAPNLFEAVENDDAIWYAVPDNKFDKHGNMKKMRKQSFDRYNLDENFYYFNIGFYLMKREARKIFRESLPEYWDREKDGIVFHDQDIINKIVHDKMRNRYRAMNKNWNGVFSVKSPDFATHYAGTAKTNFTVEGHTKLREEKSLRKGGEMYHVPQFSTDRIEVNSLENFF